MYTNNSIDNKYLISMENTKNTIKPEIQKIQAIYKSGSFVLTIALVTVRTLSHVVSALQLGLLASVNGSVP